MSLKFIVQRFTEMLPYNTKQLRQFRLNMYGQASITKQSISNAIDDEFNNNNIYINSYYNDNLIGNLKIDRLDNAIKLSRFYIKPTFRFSNFEELQLQYQFYPWIIVATEKHLDFIPEKVQINIADNANEQLVQFYKWVGFKYVPGYDEFYNFKLKRAEMDYTKLKEIIEKKTVHQHSQEIGQRRKSQAGDTVK